MMAELREDPPQNLEAGEQTPEIKNEESLSEILEPHRPLAIKDKEEEEFEKDIRPITRDTQ
jgi:hypothetical protein